MLPTFAPMLGTDELQAVQKVFDSRWLGMGEVTLRFEERLCEVLHAPHVIAVDHGTSALHLALDALELPPGAEVIVPSLTFVATIQAILQAGLTPVFCEVEPQRLGMDPLDVARRITPRTRALLPVHYAGVPADMDNLLALAQAHDLRVIEDAAHAFGSSHRGRPIGTLGDCTCFSFDAIKNITCGEGGAVAVADPVLAERMRRRRVLGIDRDRWVSREKSQGWYYQVVEHGFRYHLPNLNAAIGLAQLEKMSAFRQRKTQIARQYDSAFRDLQDVILPARHLEECFLFAYVLRIADGRRNALAEFLHQRDIRTMVHFTPNHLQPAFATYRQPLPVTETLYEQLITLPFFAAMTDAQVEQVIRGVRDFLAPGSDAAVFIPCPLDIATPAGGATSLSPAPLKGKA